MTGDKNTPGQKALAIDKKRRDKKTRQLKRNKTGITEKDLKNQKHERINKIALELSKTFTYSQIVSAIDGEGGYLVHGHLQINYEDYEDLIDNYILDRAALYSKREFTPEVIKFIKEGDLSKLVKTTVKFSKTITFDNYKELPFKEAIFYARQNLEKALIWIDGYEWELDGYDTRVTLGPANIALIGWALWNKPIFLILHAPGKNQAFFEAKMNAEKIKTEMDKIKTKIIHQYRTIQGVMVEKTDELKQDSIHWQRAFSNFKDKIETERKTNINDEFKQFEAKVLKKNRGPNFGIKDITKLIGAITVFSVVVYVLVNLSSWIGG